MSATQSKRPGADLQWAASQFRDSLDALAAAADDIAGAASALGFGEDVAEELADAEDDLNDLFRQAESNLSFLLVALGEATG